MLITNIDNFFAELFKLQIEKNHEEILVDETFLHFKVCQINKDVAYWWVMFITFLNLANCFLRSLINKYMICPNLEEFKKANEQNLTYVSSDGMKVLYILNFILISVEIIFILLPIFSIPLIKFIMVKLDKSELKPS